MSKRWLLLSNDELARELLSATEPIEPALLVAVATRLRASGARDYPMTTDFLDTPMLDWCTKCGQERLVNVHGYCEKCATGTCKQCGRADD